MPRVKRAVHSHKKRRKVLKAAKGFRGGHGRLLRSAKEAVARAPQVAYRDRRTKKRGVRGPWIHRANAHGGEGLPRRGRPRQGRPRIGKAVRHLPGTTEQIALLAEEGLRAISSAKTESDLLDAKGRYFGKKGAISEFLKGVASLALEERKRDGAAANEARTNLEAAFARRLEEIREKERRAREGVERVDVTLPGRAPALS